jgi:hypothetical protein
LHPQRHHTLYKLQGPLHNNPHERCNDRSIHRRKWGSRQTFSMWYIILCASVTAARQSRARAVSQGRTWVSCSPVLWYGNRMLVAHCFMRYSRFGCGRTELVILTNHRFCEGVWVWCLQYW